MSSLYQQWIIPPYNLHMLEHDVHVWMASLETSNSVIQNLECVLSKDEGTQAKRFHFEKDRRHWIVAHGILRILLSRYANSDPSQLRFGSNAYGKPFLAFPSLTPHLHFNLSHSMGFALYAFSYAGQVGIDVEYKRADIDYDSLAKVSFSPKEQALLRSLPDNLKCDAFFNCWTRKEAFIKAIGKGFSVPTHKFSVSIIPGEPAALLESSEEPREIMRWSLQDITPAVGYAGALAVEGTEWRLSCWRWDQ
jgi:4'-phosphopantetheinyl transferase